MSTVDQGPDPEVEVAGGSEVESGRPLRLSATVGPVPIAAGWDAEPVVLDWFGSERPDLLVTFGGGPRGRFSRI